MAALDWISRRQIPRMAPTVRVSQSRTLDRDFSLARREGADQLRDLQRNLPALERELKRTWPVTSVTIRVKNPYNPNTLELQIGVALGADILTSAAEALGRQVLDWIRHQPGRNGTSDKPSGSRRRMGRGGKKRAAGKPRRGSSTMHARS